MENKDSLLGVLETIFKWKRPIIIATLVAAVGSAIIVLLLPVYYKATTTFYAASPDLAMPESIFGTTNEGMEYYGEDEDIDRIMTIAESSELTGFLINYFNLYEHYDIDTTKAKAPYYVAEALSDLYEVKKTKYDAIELSVEDKDKELATEIANTARAKIDELAQKLIKSSQEKVLQTYESNIQSKNDQLNILNDSLQRTRIKYGVFNTETQSELLATLLAKAEARLANSRARHSALTTMPGVPRDTLTFLLARINALEKEVVTMRDKLNLFNQGMAQVDVLAQIHEEARDQLGEDEERYKQIKSAYSSYFPTIHLVEAATVPIIKSRPKRTILVLAATMLAFVFSVIGVLILEYYKDVNWRSIVNAK